MDHKSKKKSRHRSRSRSSERDRRKHNKKKHKRRYSSDDDSDHSESSGGTDYRSRKRKKTKHSSPVRRSRSRSKDRRRGQRSKSRSDSREAEMPTSVSKKIQEIEKLKEERRKQKEHQKATESVEEKRLRRLAKKEAKGRKRKEQMGWDEEYMGYSNADNPFGDEHLMDNFVWTKKFEKEGRKVDEHIHLQKEKMLENKRELEKVKRRRIEREREYEEREKEREMEQREKESEYYKAWEKQEDKFHLQQAKLRSKIRIDDGRAKPIDLLAKYISDEMEDDLTVEMHEPYTYLNGLTIEDLEDLLEDIKVYTELEEGQNMEFWKDMIIVTEDELAKLRRIDPSSKDYRSDRRETINQSVGSEVASIFRGKTTNQLELLQEQIRRKLRGGEGVDVGYWESLLQQLKAHMARSRLRERHQGQLRRKLFRLKQEQGIESQPLFPIVKKEPDDNPESAPADSVPESNPIAVSDEVPGTSQDAQPSASLEAPNDPENEVAEPGQGQGQAKEEDEEEEEEEEEDEPLLTEEDLLAQSYDEYTLGNYSPRLLRVSELEPDTIVYDPEDDMKRLEYARVHLVKTGKVRDDIDSELLKKAREGMNDDEATFGVQVKLEHQELLWSDKYRPRKPRFFNRVHTGFEWNKYNQTHYDIDNPPPKIVQGYKFNIFFPDLINKTETPEYTITPIKEEPDFAVLRFHAGPPYEDIGFKIVNKEWECSWKRGFRCQFHNNIFQLWFHFKRYRYRR